MGVQGNNCLINPSTQVSVANMNPTQLAFTVSTASNGAKAGLYMGTGVYVDSVFQQLGASDEPFDLSLLTGGQCQGAINHAVNIIDAGYDNIDGNQVGWVRLLNSWGTDWGNGSTLKIYTCGEAALWGSVSVIMHASAKVNL